MSNQIIGDGAKIPTVPVTQVTDPQLRPVVDAVRTIFNTRAFGKDQLEHWVTWRDLIASNVVVYKDGNTNLIGSGSSVFFPFGEANADFTPPPAPLNLTATAAALNIILEWDDPNYPNLAYAEIWRATTNNLGEAVRIGSTVSFLYADNVGAASLSYYYWVRFVSKQDIVGPYNSTAGTFAASGYVGGVDLSDLAVTAAKLAADAVEEGKIKDAAVTTTKIANLAVGNAAIQNAAITNAKIADLAVDSAKIADASIVTAKIADANITTAKIADAQITGAKIANATIGTANISNGAITNALISDAQITTAKIADGNITNAKIANATIIAANIADGNITNAKIQDGAITNAKIANASINAAKIIDGEITNAKIQNGAITNAKIGDAQITTAKIGVAEIDTLRIAGSSVTVSTSVATNAEWSSLWLNAPYGGVINIVAYVEGWDYNANTVLVYINGGPVLEFRGQEGYRYDGALQWTPATNLAVVGVGAGNHHVQIWNQGNISGYRPSVRVMALLTQR